MQLAVIGGGGWGLALAQVLNDNHQHITIYNREAELVQQFNQTHTSPLLPNGVILDSAMQMTDDLETCLATATHILLTVPTNAIRPVLLQIVPLLNHPVTIINAAKGIEQGTHLRISEIVKEVMPEHLCNAFVSLTGPSHAEEVVLRQFTTIVAASEDVEAAKCVQEMFSNDTYFRVYTSTDLIGAEIGGALKNVIAVAAGYLYGKGYGDNTKAALLTRGIAEIVRFGVKLGADPLTFAGLTGVGDLIVTATSKHSRNFQAGLELARGVTIDELLASKKTIEGLKTATATYELSQSLGVEMPITEFIYHVIQGKYTADDFGRVLFSRDTKSERM